MKLFSVRAHKRYILSKWIAVHCHSTDVESVSFPEDCSENRKAATGSKKSQKRTWYAGRAIYIALIRFSQAYIAFYPVPNNTNTNTNISSKDDLETFNKGKLPTDTNYTKSTEWALKNFELWPIARSVKFGDHNAQSAGSRIKKSLVDTYVDL